MQLYMLMANRRSMTSISSRKQCELTAVNIAFKTGVCEKAKAENSVRVVSVYGSKRRP